MTSTTDAPYFPNPRGEHPAPQGAHIPNPRQHDGRQWIAVQTGDLTWHLAAVGPGIARAVLDHARSTAA